MNAIYALWLRELKRYVRSRAQIIASLGQPLLYLLVLGFGLGPVFQARRQRQLPPVHRARRHRHDGALHVHLFRHRHALGPPVRLPQGNAGRPRVAHSDHDRPHPRRRHRRRHPGPHGHDHLPHRRLPPTQPALHPHRHRLHGADRHPVLRARHRHRLQPSGHAGLSAHHELPRHAHLLPLRRALSRSRASASSSSGSPASTRSPTASTACATSSARPTPPSIPASISSSS